MQQLYDVDTTALLLMLLLLLLQVMHPTGCRWWQET
jgi:hypothetical protein